MFAESATTFAELSKRAERIETVKLADLAVGLLTMPQVGDDFWFSRMRMAIYQVADAVPDSRIHCLVMAALLDCAFAQAGGYEED